MSEAYFQGSFRPTAAATIRVTYDPTGTPSTSDWVVATTDNWDSLDDLLVAWQAQIDSDLGAGKVTLTNTKSAATLHTSRITVTTDGPNFSIDWSQSGNGTDLRDWLGSAGDMSNAASGAQFTARTRAGYYLDRPLLTARLSGRTYDGSFGGMLDGDLQTQHSSDPSDQPDARFAVSWWAKAGTDQAGISAFENFVEELHDEDGGGEPFSVFHDDGTGAQQTLCRFDGQQINVWAERVRGSTPDSLWSMAVDLLLVEEVVT